MTNASSDPDQRVLVGTPNVHDAEVLSALVEEVGARAHVCSGIGDLCRQIELGADGCILAEEVLTAPARSRLLAVLSRQPHWSDFPLVVLASAGMRDEERWARLGAFRSAGSVLLLQRPMRRATVTSAIRSSLQSRVRQYQVRDELEARERAEHAVRQSEERFRAMSDRLPLIVWFHDADGEQAFVNRTFCEYFGVDRDDMTGDRWLRLCHPADAPSYRERYLDAVSRRERFQTEVRVRRADGAWRWIESWARPYFDDDGNYLGHVGASADVTDRKRAEEDLESAREELEMRVAERTAELQVRADQLSRMTSELTLAEQRERQRLAALLHDHLQQLLVSARMSLEMLAARCGEDERTLVERTQRSIDEAVHAARSLSAELAPPVLQQVGLAASFEWLADWMQDKHALNVETFVDADDDEVDEDVRTLVFTSVRELLFNVVKHSGVREARVRLHSTDDGRLCVEVSDEGRGFETSEATESKGGARTGFGLFSIIERLTLLGGQLDVDSAPGRGSRFAIRVPKTRETKPLPDEEKRTSAEKEAAVSATRDETEIRGAMPEDAVHEATRQGGPAIRVLLVDDHPIVREGLRALLSGRSIVEVVGEAEDGLDAIDKASALRPDVVLMDYSMPKMNGVEATRTICRECRDVKVIGLSMHSEREVAPAMRRAGAAACLSKAVDAETLIGHIAAVHLQRPTG